MVGDIYFRQLGQLLRAAKNDTELFEAIVNAPFHDIVRATQIDLGIIVLLLVSKEDRMIDRVSLSNTEPAAGTVRMSERPFHEIRIPLDHPDNAIARAIGTGKPQVVTDWKYLFMPALGPRAARFNQAGGGIECSSVYPLKSRDGGALIFSFYQVHNNIDEAHEKFMQTYAALVDARLRAAAKPPHGAK